MPKVIPSSRRVRLQPAQAAEYAPPQGTASSILWGSSPRKVSFEEGHQSSSSFSSQQAIAPSASTSSNSLASSTSSLSSPGKPGLRRKAPSVCLVGLAAAAAAASQDGNEDSTSHNNDALLQCLSPMPTVVVDMDMNMNSPYRQPSPSHGPSTAPSSPWGHFVDLLVPLDEEQEPFLSSSCHTDPRAMKRPRFFGSLPQVPHADEEYIRDEDDEDDDLCGGPGLCFLPSSNSNRNRQAHRPSSSSSHRRNKLRRFLPSPHPYGLLPRHHQQQQRRCKAPSPTPRQQEEGKSSFLPGFFLDTAMDRTIESSEATHHVQEALERLQV